MQTGGVLADPDISRCGASLTHRRPRGLQSARLGENAAVRYLGNLHRDTRV